MSPLLDIMSESPRVNYTFDPYYTDDLRLVVFLSEETVALDNIGWMGWETPPGPVSYMTRSRRNQ